MRVLRRTIPALLGAASLSACGGDEVRLTERGVARYGVPDEVDKTEVPAVPEPASWRAGERRAPEGAAPPAPPAAPPVAAAPAPAAGRPPEPAPAPPPADEPEDEAPPARAEPPAPAPATPPAPASAPAPTRTTPASTSGSSAPLEHGGDYAVVEVSDGGTVRGVCRISEAVKPWPVDMFKDLDKGCLAGHTTERMVHGEDRALANCLVFLRGVTKGKDWPEAMRADERQALLDQKGCKYVPHVQWVRAETQLVIGNSDRADHNIHGYRGSIENTQFNFISAPGTTQSDVDKAFLETPTAYLVKCDIHPWMNAYVHVVTHPYHDVTSEKAVGDKKPGEYVLTDVPPGEYELFCWHEGMEEKAQVNQGQVNAYVYGRDFLAQKRVKVEPKGTVTEDFTVPAPASAR